MDSDEELAGPLAELPDLSELDLIHVHRLGNSALDNCLRRIVLEADSGTSVIAGFDAVIEGRPEKRALP